MTRPAQHLLSRKDIAQLFGLSVYQVRVNEKRFGLDRTRRDVNRRCVRYNTVLAWPILISRFGPLKTH